MRARRLEFRALSCAVPGPIQCWYVPMNNGRAVGCLGIYSMCIIKRFSSVQHIVYTVVHRVCCLTMGSKGSLFKYSAAKNIFTSCISVSYSFVTHCRTFPSRTGWGGSMPLKLYRMSECLWSAPGKRDIDYLVPDTVVKTKSLTFKTFVFVPKY